MNSLRVRRPSSDSVRASRRSDCIGLVQGVARRKSIWSVSIKELRVILLVTGVLLWMFTVQVWTKAPIPCGDFVCPYTMGSLVRDAPRLYDVDAFHAVQVALVPSSASLFYPPVYPPQMAVLMAPFSQLPFRTAVFVWSVITVTLYACIGIASHRALGSRLDLSVLALAAFAFPPFVTMVGYGQNTVLLLGACFVSWRALDRQKPFLAGVALGLLALKPQFGLPFVVIVVAGREWRVLAGAVCSIFIQTVVVWLVMGPAAFSGFLAMVPDIVRNVDALEAATQQTHSLRTLTRLLPPVIGQPLWLAGVGVVLWCVANVWRSSAPVHVRLGVTILAAVLASPHLIAYDAVLLSLPLFWFGDWFQVNGSAGGYWTGVALMFLTLAFSWATVLRIQPSVLVMVWIGYRVWRATREELHTVQSSVSA